MAVSKYSQILQGPQFTARSFDELNYAPSILREKHDKAEEALNENLKNARSVEVGSKYRDQVNDYLNNLESSVDGLINNMNTSGINSNTILEDFSTLKRKLDKDYSNTGMIGIAANTHKRVQEANNAALKLAVEQNQSPEDAMGWAKRDEEAYYKDMTDDLSKLTTAPGEYRPTLAPKYMDVSAAAEPVLRNLGKFSEGRQADYLRTGNFTFDTDANGNKILIGYDKNNQITDKVIVKNDENLSRAYDYIVAMLNDKTSLLSQNLAYKGTDADKLLTQALKLLGAAESKVDNESTRDHVEFQPVGGGGGRGYGGGSSSTVKDEKVDEDNPNIINEDFVGGKISANAGDIMDRLDELEKTNEADMTPQLIAERNQLRLQNKVIKSGTNQMVSTYLTPNGLLKPEYQDRRLKQSTLDSDFYKKSTKQAHLAASKVLRQVNEKLGINAPENYYKDSSVLGRTVADFNIDGGDRSMTNTIYSAVQRAGNGTKFTRDQVATLVKKAREDYNKELAGKEKLMANEKAQMFAREDIRGRAIDTRYTSYSINAINSDSAAKNPKNLTGFKEILSNMIKNGAGGGKIDMLNAKGEDVTIDMSDANSVADFNKLVQSTDNVTFDSIDFTPAGPLLRYSFLGKDGNATTTNSFNVPIRTMTDTNTGLQKLDENTETLLNRLYTLGSQRDKERVISIKNEILVSRQGTEIYTQYDGRSASASSMVKTKSLAKSFNSSGYSKGNEKLGIDSSKLSYEYYPYNRKGLVDIGIEVQPDNYYATRYKVKKADGTQSKGYHYMSGSDIVETNAQRMFLKGTNEYGNDATKNVFKSMSLSNTMAKLTSKDIKGVFAEDNFALYSDNPNNLGIVPNYNKQAESIRQKYINLAQNNITAGYVNAEQTTNRFNPLYRNLSPEQIKAFEEDNSALSTYTLERLRKIKVSTKQKNDLF